ncbi:hypothetical protein XFF6992_70002 [Xanthomonas citri pv. fuscans]|nr:hypothetical protein XFF6992_70002 [Xanthomonas citri pv. fuscans]SOO34844.1 hypothetical protein XFF6994_470007 [Xanthomonas citri pv. fuscans]
MAVVAAAADLAAAHGHAGREQGRPLHTHLLRSFHSRRSAKSLKHGQHNNQIFAMYFYVTHGMIGKDQLKSSMSFLWLQG